MSLSSPQEHIHISVDYPDNHFPPRLALILVFIHLSNTYQTDPLLFVAMSEKVILYDLASRLDACWNPNVWKSTPIHISIFPPITTADLSARPTGSQLQECPVHYRMGRVSRLGSQVEGDVRKDIMQ